MNKVRDPAFPVLAGLFLLTVLGSTVRYLLRPSCSFRLLDGPAAIWRQTDGTARSLTDLLPPQGNGRMLLFFFPRDATEFQLIAATWERVRRKSRGPVLVVAVTARPERLANLAAWLRMPSPLWIHPDILHQRLRIPGLPAELEFSRGEPVHCRVMAR